MLSNTVLDVNDERLTDPYIIVANETLLSGSAHARVLYMAYTWFTAVYNRLNALPNDAPITNLNIALNSTSVRPVTGNYLVRRRIERSNFL